ncbi:hypothetical protein GQ600_8260 [Phytophthora cactorum]|nr:hypothetical protein GQ600_8260 [Phytophthora cactorum]
MSFLLTGPVLTLGEVLAFIDSCETSGAIDSDAGDMLLGSGDVCQPTSACTKHPRLRRGRGAI